MQSDKGRHAHAQGVPGHSLNPGSAASGGGRQMRLERWGVEGPGRKFGLFPVKR